MHFRPAVEVRPGALRLPRLPALRELALVVGNARRGFDAGDVAGVLADLDQLDVLEARFTSTEALHQVLSAGLPPNLSVLVAYMESGDYGSVRSDAGDLVPALPSCLRSLSVPREPHFGRPAIHALLKQCPDLETAKLWPDRGGHDALIAAAEDRGRFLVLAAMGVSDDDERDLADAGHSMVSPTDMAIGVDWRTPGGVVVKQAGGLC